MPSSTTSTWDSRCSSAYSSSTPTLPELPTTSGYKNQRFRARLGFALRGLAQALRTEASLRVQALAGALALAALLVLRPAPVWWALVLLASGAVVAAELFNTAIEHLADLLHPQQSPEVRLVKDCAAAGVLIAVLGALGVAVALLVHLLSAAA